MDNIIITLRTQSPDKQFDIEVPADTPLGKFKEDVLESVSSYCNVTFVDDYTIYFDRMGMDIDACMKRDGREATLGSVGVLNGDYAAICRV